MRKVSAWFGVATLFVLMSSAQAQNDVLKPYVVLILDTSGSMDIPTGAGPTSCGKPDKRINHAVCAINNIVNSYGDMVFSLSRFRETTNGTGTPGSQICDGAVLPPDQNGNVNGTLPTPSGGDVCNTQGAYCGDCDSLTGNDRSCKYCTTSTDCGSGYSCDNSSPSFRHTCFKTCTVAGDCSLPGDVCSGLNGSGTCANPPCYCQNACTGPDACSQTTSKCTGPGICNTKDNNFEVLSPLVDGNNTVAAEYTNGTCNTCNTINAGALEPEIWGVSPYTFTPLAAVLAGDKRYWQGLQATDTTVIWSPNLAGYDPINRDPNNNVFLNPGVQTTCDPSATCTGANCCISQCRPYVTILLTDGDETCTAFSNTTANAASLLTTSPHDDSVPISSVIRSGGTVSAQTGTAHPFRVGDAIVVAGVTDTSFNSAANTYFTVATVTDAQHFTYVQGGNPPNASSSGGTVGHRATQNRYRIETKPIGFGLTPGDANIEAIAHAGGAPDLPGVNEGYYAANEADLEIAISQILADSVRSELCNGRDDDCDTRVDEDFTTGGTCQATWPVGDPQAGQVAVGVCANTGTTQCKLDGTGTECSASPNPRQCNPLAAGGECGGVGGCDGLDNDCDGRVDEGLSCQSCVPTGEICDGNDNDCDTVPDQTCRCSNNSATRCDGTNAACGGGATSCVCTPIVRDCANSVPGVGSCPGTQQCSGGTFGTCNPLPGYPATPTTEVCNGKDDNCDGVCDGIPADCSEVNGACDPNSVTSCPASNNPGDPSHGPVAHPESGTKCANAIDDDADGVINDGCPAVGAPETACTDNLDNDNDGSVNDGCPTVVNPLISQNVCHAGARDCPQSCAGTNSFSSCSGEVKPAATDPCNGLDDDCDNVVDEDFTAADCSTNCGVGTTQCVNGNITCNSQPATNDTTCNNVDDDCDGKFDEDWVCTDNPINGVCSCGTGLVCAGQEKCVNGAVVCQGDPIGTEVCNCLDDNCNNQVDEGTICPSGSTCTNCQCAFPCAQGEFPCPLGKKCEMSSQGDFCVNDPCFNVSCPAVNGNAQTCIPKPGFPNEPQCVDTCTQVTCTGNLICYGPAGECRPNNCTTFPDMCTATQSCVNGTCVSNPCQGVTCDTGTYCVGGSCVESCADVECPAGQRCRLGACETDPCGHACPFGQVCNDNTGKCIDDGCKVRVCDQGQWCNPNSQQCEDDPCVTSHVVCPNPGEVCRGGTCIDPDSLRPDAGDEAHVTVGGGGGCSTTGNGSMGVLVALAMLGLRRRKRVPGARRGGVQ